MNIITNHVPRDVIYGHELTEKEREDFDYVDFTSDDQGTYFRYKGEVYDLGEFTSMGTIWSPMVDELRTWDGILHDSFYSGIVVKYVEDFERVIVGRYYT